MFAPFAIRKSLCRLGAASLCLCGLAAPAGASGDVADASSSPSQAASVAGQDDTVATSPAAGALTGRSLEDAVASVVVVALTEQFDGRPIAVNIDSFDVQVSSARQRLVSGRGRVDVDGAAGLIAFSYRTLYDVVASNAGYPAISIDRVGAGPAGGADAVDVGVEHPVPNDAALIGELDRRIASTLSAELGGKTVWLQLDEIESFETGERYVRINAAGIADFGRDGRTPARVEALYDRSRQAWLRVNYELGMAPMAGELLSATGG